MDEVNTMTNEEYDELIKRLETAERKIITLANRLPKRYKGEAKSLVEKVRRVFEDLQANLTLRQYNNYGVLDTKDITRLKSFEKRVIAAKDTTRSIFYLVPVSKAKECVGAFILVQMALDEIAELCEAHHSKGKSNEPLNP